MPSTITRTIVGKVVINPFGDWSDCDRGVYLDGDNVVSIFEDYEGRRLRVTIEEVEEVEEDE